MITKEQYDLHDCPAEFGNSEESCQLCEDWEQQRINTEKAVHAFIQANKALVDELKKSFQDLEDLMNK